MQSYSTFFMIRNLFNKKHGGFVQVSYEALKKRYDQGWVLEIIDDLDQLIERVKEARQKKQV